MPVLQWARSNIPGAILLIILAGLITVCKYFYTPLFAERTFRTRDVHPIEIVPKMTGPVTAWNKCLIGSYETYFSSDFEIWEMV